MRIAISTCTWMVFLAFFMHCGKKQPTALGGNNGGDTKPFSGKFTPPCLLCDDPQPLVVTGNAADPFAENTPPATVKPASNKGTDASITVTNTPAVKNDPSRPAVDTDQASTGSKPPTSSATTTASVAAPTTPLVAPIAASKPVEPASPETDKPKQKKKKVNLF